MTTCPDECVMCRYDRHTPIEPRPGILEGAVAGFGIAAGAWFGAWIFYTLGRWVVEAGYGTASLIWVGTVGALAGVFAATTGRR